MKSLEVCRTILIPYLPKEEVSHDVARHFMVNAPCSTTMRKKKTQICKDRESIIRAFGNALVQPGQAGDIEDREITSMKVVSEVFAWVVEPIVSPPGDFIAEEEVSQIGYDNTNGSHRVPRSAIRNLNCKSLKFLFRDLCLTSKYR